MTTDDSPTAMNDNSSVTQVDKRYQTAQHALRLDPLNPGYRQFSARIAAMKGDAKSAAKHFAAAISLAPTNSRILQHAGYFLFQQDRSNIAVTLLKNSISYDKFNIPAYLTYAAVLFEGHRREQGLEILKAAMMIDPNATDNCLAMMMLYQISEYQMQTTLPNRVESHLALGDFFNSLGKKQEAETVYREALNYLPNEKQVSKKIFLRVYQFYINNQLNEDALTVILQAIGYFENDPQLHLIAGDLYRRIGIDYRANEEYRKAAILKSK